MAGKLYNLAGGAIAATSHDAVVQRCRWCTRGAIAYCTVPVRKQVQITIRSLVKGRDYDRGGLKKPAVYHVRAKESVYDGLIEITWLNRSRGTEEKTVDAPRAKILAWQSEPCGAACCAEHGAISNAGCSCKFHIDQPVEEEEGQLGLRF